MRPITVVVHAVMLVATSVLVMGTAGPVAAQDLARPAALPQWCRWPPNPLLMGGPCALGELTPRPGPDENKRSQERSKELADEKLRMERERRGKSPGAD